MRIVVSGIDERRGGRGAGEGERGGGLLSSVLLLLSLKIRRAPSARATPGWPRRAAEDDLAPQELTRWSGPRGRRRRATGAARARAASFVLLSSAEQVLLLLRPRRPRATANHVVRMGLARYRRYCALLSGLEARAWAFQRRNQGDGADRLEVWRVVGNEDDDHERDARVQRRRYGEVVVVRRRRVRSVCDVQDGVQRETRPTALRGPRQQSGDDRRRAPRPADGDDAALVQKPQRRLPLSRLPHTTHTHTHTHRACDSTSQRLSHTHNAPDRYTFAQRERLSLSLAPSPLPCPPLVPLPPAGPAPLPHP